MKFWRWVYQWKWTWYATAYLFCIMMMSWVITMLAQGLSWLYFGEQLPVWFMFFIWMLWVVPTFLYIIYHYDRNQIKDKYATQGLDW
ncbi:MAG: hypothetical protein E3J35_09745 [Methanomassiliicoccales archaeon]|nr:MAG: hypothetical protein E3J35_09745 [Methanomassiliicoccales archaeon]